MITLFDKIIVGSMLGDGSIILPYDNGKPGNPYFSEAKALDHIDYLDWLEENLNPPLNFIKRYHRETQMDDKRLNELYISTSSRSALLKRYRELWYPCKPRDKEEYVTKIIPRNYVAQNFTDLSFALWYMGDGYIIHRKRKGKSGQLWRYDEVQICTQGFPADDVLWLKCFIESRYKIHMGKTRVSNSFRLAIHRQKEITKIFNCIEPYFSRIKSMKYKLKRAKQDTELRDKKPVG